MDEITNDRIVTYVTIHYDWKDRLRILFGKTAYVKSIVHTKHRVEVIKSTESLAYVEPIFNKKRKEIIETNLGHEHKDTM